MLQRHIAVIRFVLLLATRICCFLQAEYKCQSDCLHCFVHDKLVLKGLILGCKSLINIVVWFSIAVTLVALFGLKVYIKYIWKPNFPFLCKVTKWLLAFKSTVRYKFYKGPKRSLCKCFLDLDDTVHYETEGFKAHFAWAISRARNLWKPYDVVQTSKRRYDDNSLLSRYRKINPHHRMIDRFSQLKSGVPKE